MLSKLFAFLGFHTEPPPDIEISQASLEALHQDLIQMHGIMIQDQEKTLSKGVLSAAKSIELAIAKPEERNASYRKAESTFLGLWGGMGSLNDYYVLHVSPQEAKERRAEFNSLAGRILSFFEKHRTPV
ncbi:MAG: hypothetical protein VX278_05260 [Myxococcota bacterium]|nr:hypothetical protein [Myxococcota bacterium]